MKTGNPVSTLGRTGETADTLGGFAERNFRYRSRLISCGFRVALSRSGIHECSDNVFADVLVDRVKWRANSSILQGGSGVNRIGNVSFYYQKNVRNFV